LWYFDVIKMIYGPAWEQVKDEDIPPSYRYHALNITQADNQASSGGALDYNPLIENGSFCIGSPGRCIETIQM